MRMPNSNATYFADNALLPNSNSTYFADNTFLPNSKIWSLLFPN